jgi:hypothetical protein
MLHRSPREFGRDSSLWTLEMAAQVAFEEGLTQRRVSPETLRTTLARLLVLGSEMAAGQTLDHLPRSLVRKKKRRRERLMEVAAASPEWAIGFEDECWWSRLALPTLSSWAEEGKPMHLIQRSVAKETIPAELRRPSLATDSICQSSAIGG